MADASNESIKTALKSIVRDNLMTRKGYTPYCGDMNCRWGMPRTKFNGKQFACDCGWTSKFEAEFIGEYKAHWDSAAR